MGNNIIAISPTPNDDVYAIIGNMDFKEAELRALALHAGVKFEVLSANIQSACAAASLSAREFAERISELSAKMPEIEFEPSDTLPTDGNLRRLVKLGQKNLNKKVCKR